MKKNYLILALKGLAIIGVLVIHAISSFFPTSYWSPNYQIFAIIFDQTSRICVPLFIALSGYTLSLKYQLTPFSLSDFITRRLSKLIPAYFIASLCIFLLLELIPEWSRSNKIIHWQTFPYHFLTGQIDYQLYFVPMIISLYFIFPFLRLIVKKFPLPTLLLTIGIQALYILSIRTGVIGQISPTILQNEYLQNINPLAWIAYFTLGIFLATSKFVFTSAPKYFETVAIWKFLTQKKLTILFLIFSFIECYFLIHTGTNPLFARSFHKLSTFVFTLSSIYYLLKLPSPNAENAKLFILLGNWSYIIFLLHTIVYRIIADNLNHHLSLTSTLISSTAIIFITLVIRKFKLG